LRMSPCWMRWPDWPKRVAPETIDRRDGQTMQIMIKLPEDIAVGLESKRWEQVLVDGLLPEFVGDRAANPPLGADDPRRRYG